MHQEAPTAGMLLWGVQPKGPQTCPPRGANPRGTLFWGSPALPEGVSLGMRAPMLPKRLREG